VKAAVRASRVADARTDLRDRRSALENRFIRLFLSE